MALRLHSRLVLWNLFLVSLASFILSFFLTASQLALMIVVAVAAAFIFTYGVHVLVLRPLHRISLVSRKLASFFFFQAEDGIRDGRVTGVQTCALPISPASSRSASSAARWLSSSAPT